MTTDVEALIGDLVRMCMRAAEALRSQAERIQALEAKCALLAASLAQEEAKCAELERDRERYQWLANRVLACDYGDNNAPGQQIGWRICHDLLRAKNGERQPAFMFGASINSAIDAAIAAQAGSKEG